MYYSRLEIMKILETIDDISKLSPVRKPPDMCLYDVPGSTVERDGDLA